MDKNIENKIKTPFGWQRNLVYFKEVVLIKFKSLNQYKLNFYSGLQINLVGILIQTLFLFILYNNFNEIIGWEFHQYVFFLLISNFLFRIAGVIIFGINLSQELISGSFNSYLTKPINVFIQNLLSRFGVIPLLMAIIYFVLLIIYLFVFSSNIDYIKLFLLFPFFSFSVLFNISILKFFDSLAFFMKASRFLISTYFRLSGVFVSNPITLFPQNVWKFLHIFARIFYGSYATLFLFGQMSYEYFLILNLLLISLTILFSCGTYLLWHFGLKKYEAFG